MDKVEHGNKTIKGQVDSDPVITQSQNNNDILRFNLWATDNIIYRIMTMQNCQSIFEKIKVGDFLTISGKHQTSQYNDDEVEEIVFARIQRWEPSWKLTSEIINALQEICTKLLNKELEIDERLSIVENIPAEDRLKIAVLTDTFHRHLLALQILNHECRPLTEGEDVKLVYDGKENIYAKVCTP